MLPALHNLPVWIVRGTGRVVTEHSVLESKVNTLLYAVMGVNRQIGRLAIRDPRTADKHDMICTLAELKGIQLSTAFKKARKGLEIVSTRRDHVAHGVWVLEPESQKPHLVITRGAWNKVEPKSPRIDRTIHPQGVDLEPIDFENLVRSIQKLVNVLVNEIEVLRASPPTSHETPLLRRPRKSRRPTEGDN